MAEPVNFEPGCVPVGNAIVCGPGGVDIRSRWNCPECGPDRRRVVAEPNSAYYGPILYCECGDHFWTDDGRQRARRPFERGWREKAKARFEDMWEKALPEGTDPIREDEYGFLSGVRLPDGTEVLR